MHGLRDGPGGHPHMPWRFGVPGREGKQGKGPGWRMLIFQDFLYIHLLDFKIYPNKLDLLALNYFFSKVSNVGVKLH